MQRNAPNPHTATRPTWATRSEETRAEATRSEATRAEATP
jgi:hypothetical protein